MEIAVISNFHHQRPHGGIDKSGPLNPNSPIELVIILQIPSQNSHQAEIWYGGPR